MQGFARSASLTSTARQTHVASKTATDQDNAARNTKPSKPSPQYGLLLGNRLVTEQLWQQPRMVLGSEVVGPIKVETLETTSLNITRPMIFVVGERTAGCVRTSPRLGLGHCGGMLRSRRRF